LENLRKILGILLGLIAIFLFAFEITKFEVTDLQWSWFDYINIVVGAIAGAVLIGNSAQNFLGRFLGALLWVIVTFLVLYHIENFKVSDVDWDWTNYVNIVVSVFAGYFLFRRD
jgi:uncharacterized membrane protein